MRLYETADLSGEAAIRGCGEIDFAGETRPRLGRIALLSKLGAGGMGVVYHGVHTRLEEEVAVKVLPRADLDRNPDLAARFLREARYARRLDSPNVVRVLDADEDPGSGCHFIVMEYVPGVTSSVWSRSFREEPVPEEQALDVCIAVCRGLAAAHDAGIVHRDVKPDNLLIPSDVGGELRPGDAKLADLGLARADSGEASLTGTAMAMGTPGYMAPEQIRGAKDAGKPADVFAMGATLFSLLAGESPFAGANPVDTMVRTATGTSLSIGKVRSDVSITTSAVIASCLRPDPADRFPDSGALLEALEATRRAAGLDEEGGADSPPAVVPAPGAMADLVGETVGHCTLEELLHEGGRTSVFRAMYPYMEQPVAFRILNPDVACDPEISDRFVQGHAFSASTLQHPGLDQIHKVGRDEPRDLYYAICELVEGESLDERVERVGPLEPAAGLAMLRGACDALAAAHELRFIHGHLSPRTLMLATDGLVRIVGCCQFTGTSSDSGRSVGDPRYSAPEALEKRRTGKDTDVYGLGVTAFYALAGRPPFDSVHGANVVLSILSAEPPRLSDHAGGVSSELSDLVGRMMARDRKDRFKDAKEVLAALPGGDA